MAVLTSSPRSFVRWKILAVICAASCVSYMLRTNLSVVGEKMMTELGFTAVELGVALSAFVWGYALFQFPGGLLGNRFGARKVFVWMALSWAALTALTGCIPGRSIASITTILIVLVSVRFLVGAANAPIFPVVGGAIGNWFPVSSWGLPNGLTTTAYTLGAAATAPLLVWITDIAGWRMSFFFTAPLGVLIAILSSWYIRDYPKDHPAVTKNELDLIDAGRTPPPDTQIDKQVWKQLLKDRNVLLLTFSYFCMNYVFYLFFNWFFIYLIDVRKIADHEAGILSAVQWIAGAVGAVLGGYICDRCAQRFGARWGYRMVPIPALLLAGVLLVAGAWTQNSYIAVMFFSLCFAFIQITDPFYWAAIVAVAGRHATAAGGVLNTGGNAVGGFVAILIPLTARSFGWPVAVGTGAIFACFSALFLFLVRADIQMKEES